MNEITYNGKNLSDFGVYYDSHSAFGSPERDVELVEVAGKNGALIIDNDRFRNIDLTFPCYINTNFLAQYRNALAYLQSCKGYNRLEYSQEPNHFRMASFNMGSQPTPNQLHRSGQFPVVFNCKPQRFLKSGETPVSSQSQDEEYEGNPAVIDNPSGLSTVKSLEVGLEPIQSGSGDPAPDNVRPITGYTEVNVTRTGKNLFNKDDASMTVNKLYPGQNGIGTSNNAASVLVPCKPNTIYTVSKVVSNRFRVAWVDDYPVNGNPCYDLVDDASASSITITTGATAKYLISYVWVNTDSLTKNEIYATVQVEVGATATTYEEYQGTTKTVSLGTTVYGGTVDLATGVLTTTMLYKNISKSDITSTGSYVSGASDSTSYYFNLVNVLPYDAIQSSATTSENLISDKFVGRGGLYSNRTVEGITQNVKYISVRVNASRLAGATVSDLADYLPNGFEVAYTLATPTTTQLTAEQISLLTGINVISTDGNTLKVTVSEPSLLVNPTLFESKPLLRIYGTGTVNINNQYITISAHSFPYIDIDCELMDAYYGSSNANQYVTFSDNDYITLKSGNNYIAYGNQIEVTPRWYEI